MGEYYLGLLAVGTVIAVLLLPWEGKLTGMEARQARAVLHVLLVSHTWPILIAIGLWLAGVWYVGEWRKWWEEGPPTRDQY